MGPVSQQSHLLLMGSEGLVWHRRMDCLRPGPVLESSRAFSRAALSSTPVRWARWRLFRPRLWPNALVDGRRVEQEVHSRRQVFRNARARARACALLGRGGCRRCVAEIPAVAQGVWLAVQVAANLDRQWWMLCAALWCSGSGYRRGPDTGSEAFWGGGGFSGLLRALGR